MVIWVCEASEVNNLTVLAVGPNGRDKDDNNNKEEDKIGSSGSDPPKGSDKNCKTRPTPKQYSTLLKSLRLSWMLSAQMDK